jgi:hypothetical protein
MMISGLFLSIRRSSSGFLFLMDWKLMIKHRRGRWFLDSLDLGVEGDERDNGGPKEMGDSPICEVVWFRGSSSRSSRTTKELFERILFEGLGMDDRLVFPQWRQTHVALVWEARWLYELRLKC